jgi:hypothetical protein
MEHFITSAVETMSLSKPRFSQTFLAGSVLGIYRQSCETVARYQCTIELHIYEVAALLKMHGLMCVECSVVCLSLQRRIF